MYTGLVHCHHDHLVLDERDMNLMRWYQLWIDTVRKAKKTPEWLPSHADIMKSRLFWWIRSGHDPLPYPPPCAYSCPWYEVVTEDGNHGAMQFDILPEHSVAPGKALISQSIYDVIEKRPDTEYIVGFGPYRFRAFRDIDLYAKKIATINPHQDYDALYHRILNENLESFDTGWWLIRVKDLEDWSEFEQPSGAVQIPPSIGGTTMIKGGGG